MSTSTKSQQVIVGMAHDEEGIVSVGVIRVDRCMSGDRDLSTGRFRYAPSYLSRPDAVSLDPVHLPLSDAEFRFATMGGLPSAIRDCAPDNWGRLMIRRFHNAHGNDAPLGEVDYLLTSPPDRTGNLHFAVDFDAQGRPQWDKRMLDPGQIPDVKWLREYVIEVLKDPQGLSKTMRPELEVLLTGAGGARPKINITTPKGTYLVKLPMPGSDPICNAQLEDASLQMAALCGITTAPAVARQTEHEDVLTVKRFDRRHDTPGVARRLQMVSAMTVLGADDAPYRWDNWSYPMLAVELGRWSSDPATDREQLFRSMVIRAMLSDGDDHPRNYALIRDPHAAGNRGGSTLGQWRLAPMYDCVTGWGKARKETSLAMKIGVMGNEINEDNILSQCQAFGLSADKARSIMLDIQAKVLEQFPAVLRRCRLPEDQIAQVMTAVTPLNQRFVDSPIRRLLEGQGRADEVHDAGDWDRDRGG